jgi:penicillin-binding protein 2
MTDRFWLLAVLFALVMGTFLIRLMDLQLIQGDRLAQAVDQSRLVTEVIPPRRGRILDRKGAPLVDNKAVYHLGVVLADLELSGRARRLIPLWRLDEQHTDALVAELAVRLRRPPLGIRDALTHDLVNHPAVAVRRGARVRSADLKLVAMPRRALAPTGGERDAEVAQLVGGDLVSEDPREALARELTLRWQQPIGLVTEGEFRAATSLLDQDFSQTFDHCAPVLEPFLPHFSVSLALEDGTTVALDLRLIDPDRRAQAEDVLARLLNETPALIHERFERALAAVREKPSPSLYYFAASSRAESIAPLLPADQGLHELPIAGVPGLRERILLIQGDAPENDGLFAQVTRRLAATLGTDADLIESLITRHAERQRPVNAEREFQVRQVILDPRRYDRLCAGLAAELTRLGRPTTRLDIEAALAKARTIADRAWTGQTRLDLIPLIENVPHPIAVRIAGIGSRPPADLAAAYEETDAALPGLGLQVDLGREYPFPGSASHLIGNIRRGEDPEDPGSFSWQGISGLEKTYDAVLRGAPGTIVRARTPDGRRVLRDDPPLAGTDLTVELDMELQTLAEDSLNRWFELAEALGTATDRMKAGLAVGKGRAGFAMIDCHTGAIIALASSPGYKLEDLNDHYDELLAAPGNPMLNYATMPDQPPGSSMKICTALAGLEYGALVPGEHIHSQGYMALVHGQKVLRDHAPPGDYDLAHAIQVSSNVYFAIIAQRLGGEKLAEVASRFGLGSNNTLDVADQRPGILPRPATIARVRPREPHWLPSDDWRLGIGQFLTASPIQVACLAAAVANGGHVVRPYLVKPSTQPVVRDLNIRQAYLDELRHGMEMVTDNVPGSTAKLLVLEGAAAGIKVAAKTGTAEWGSSASREAGRTPDHSWMAGYAPAHNPTIAFAIFVHSGTFGGQACSPIAKRVLERYFIKYGPGGHAAERR